MKTEQAFIVPWESKRRRYHRGVAELPWMECGTWLSRCRIRIEGKGAEDWLKRNGYTLCGNCARVMKAREKKEADNAD